MLRYGIFFILALVCLAFMTMAPAGFAAGQEDSGLQKRLYDAYQAKGKDYKPRTEHLKSDGSPVYINRLILEESPYLIQHAHNPVNWYAWGSEAFAKAKRENKPVFLSIGYSTCHWCHVMERESFDNETIAKYLNEHFIAIKVDRERRPDIDKIYMTATMLINRSGGWPMSSLLTPEGKPFFAATYFPPENFMQLLKRSTVLWKEDQQTLRDMADKVSRAVQASQQRGQAAEKIGRERSQLAVINIMHGFDEMQGGFSLSPKFPNEPYLFLLLDAVIRDAGMKNSQDVFKALKLTLDMMARGGIYDQIGGGFHRYSTDNQWLVPHFEKMLYNQAHLVRVYLQFYRLTEDPVYYRIVTQTLDYVLAEMLSDDKAFLSAGDADSEGEEGRFFVWTMKQIQQALSSDLAKQAIELYAVTETGNFEQHNILHLPVSLPDYARHHKLTLDELFSRVDQINKQLYQHRSQRIAPAIDNKVVTAWNGMMITAFAQAGKQLKRNDYLQAAIDAAEFLWLTHHFNSNSNSNSNSNTKHSGLWRVSLKGKPSVAATQEDYAYLIQASIALYDATEKPVWLQRAQQLNREMIDSFWDTSDGGFYMSSTEQEVALFDRPRDLTDGAIPSGNSVALEGLVKLYHRSGDEQYHEKAVALLASVSSLVKQSPGSFAYLLMAANQLRGGETGDVQYGAKGHVRIEKQVISQSSDKIELAIHFSMQKGWHINSRFPNSKELIATAVSVDKQADWKIVRAEYPQGEKVKLKFNDQPLSVYQNRVTIKAVLVPKRVAAGKPAANDKQLNIPDIIPLRINYQSCSDKICLAPAQNVLYLFNNT
jgi:uncharacterized protein YyaL (SSP411 family)